MKSNIKIPDEMSRCDTYEILYEKEYEKSKCDTYEMRDI